MIDGVGTNMLRWFLVEMRKRIYVEFNKLFYKVCKIVWVIKVELKMSYLNMIIDAFIWEY